MFLCESNLVGEMITLVFGSSFIGTPHCHFLKVISSSPKSLLLDVWEWLNKVKYNQKNDKDSTKHNANGKWVGYDEDISLILRIQIVFGRKGLKM
jgi:hypothetical protein